MTDGLRNITSQWVGKRLHLCQRRRGRFLHSVDVTSYPRHALQPDAIRGFRVQPGCNFVVSLAELRVTGCGRHRWEVSGTGSQRQQWCCIDCPRLSETARSDPIGAPNIVSVIQHGASLTSSGPQPRTLLERPAICY